MQTAGHAFCVGQVAARNGRERRDGDDGGGVEAAPSEASGRRRRQATCNQKGRESDKDESAHEGLHCMVVVGQKVKTVRVKRVSS